MIQRLKQIANTKPRHIIEADLNRVEFFGIESDPKLIFEIYCFSTLNRVEFFEIRLEFPVKEINCDLKSRKTARITL